MYIQKGSEISCFIVFFFLTLEGVGSAVCVGDATTVATVG